MGPTQLSTFLGWGISICLTQVTGFKCLPIVPYSSSELQYYFMILGRMGHSNHKCFSCDASVTTFGECACRGRNWTTERIQTEITNYAIANAAAGSPLLHGLTPEEIQVKRAVSKEDSSKSGIKIFDVLFKNIELRNFKCLGLARE